jgi:YYY domain-containing protein
MAEFSNNSGRKNPFTLSNFVSGVLLVAIMLVGGYFRFVGLSWDDYSFWHPDERFITLQVLPAVGTTLAFTGSDPLSELNTCAARYPATGGEGGFFDTQCSIWNPNNVGVPRYVYGTLPLFLANMVDDTWRALAWGADNRPDAEMIAAGLPGDAIMPGLRYDGGHISWRFMSALFDCGTIVITFLIGMRLHNKWVGLLAALLYAAAPLPIQKAHYGTVNATTGFFAAMAVLFAVTVQKKGGGWNYIFFGVSFAAALAGRINIAPLFGLIIAAAALRIVPAFDGKIDPEERNEILSQNILGLIMAGLAAVLSFRIFNPYAFMGPSFFGFGINPRWLADIQSSSYDVSGLQDSPPNWQWVGRTAYLFPLSHMVLWGMGVFFGVTAWLSWGWAGFQVLRSRLRSTTNMLLVGWVLVYFGWLGAIWVVPMRYFLPIYPALAVLAAWGVWEILKRAQGYASDAETVRRFSVVGRVFAYALLVIVGGGTLLWGVMFTNIYRHQLTRVQAAYWVREHISGDFSMQVDDAPENTPLINIALPNRAYNQTSNDPFQTATYLDNTQPAFYDFTATATGTVSTVYAPHLGDPQDDPDPEMLHITISDIESGQIYAEATVADDFTRDTHILGNAYSFPLDAPMSVTQGERYRFTVQVLNGGPVIIGGSVVASEGDWDDRITDTTACPRPVTVTVESDPPPGTISAQDCARHQAWYDLVLNYDMYMSFPEDVQLKHDAILEGLNHSDYITISSNRFYDSETRNPERFPMTTRYYEALFSGEFGYELIAVFDETFEFGPFRVSDQYLPIYDAPRWLNEFESDESFHVYDHPAVFIFRKTADYSPEVAAAIMGSVPLTTVNDVTPIFSCPESAGEYYCNSSVIGVVSLPSFTFDQSPTFLQMPTDIREANLDGGTWSLRFDWNSFINTQPVLMVFIWWLMIIGFGWIAFPFLFAISPMLADRGYGFSKFAGMLLVGWLAWYVSSARVPMWSQGGIALAALCVAALSAAMLWLKRGEFVKYVGANVRSMLIMEAIMFVAFLAFVGVRLTNPDLWHPFFGGEKPMDFSYFNGVLRTTVFPPIDPWYGGGYINYYYFGYVIVGAPTLLLGVVPSIAYNVIIPTLFAVTGMGAFSVAFNVVSAWRDRRVTTLPEAEGEEPRTVVSFIRPGNPWIAGIAAFLLTVVLGNLDTPRVFIAEGLTTTGFYNNPGGLAAQYVADYSLQNGGAMPDEATLADINQRAVQDSASVFGSIMRGFWRVLQGNPLSMATNRWFWAPTRVIDDASPHLIDNEIAEMPYFTFLYGDLHAHMIAMPLMFIGMSFILSELLMSGQRFGGVRLLGLAFGGLVIGIMRATNTWDWVTYMVLGVLGLGFAWWLNWRERLTMRSLVYLAALGGFVVMIVMIPLLASVLRVPSENIATPTRLMIAGLGAAAGACFLGWLGVTRRSLLYLLLYIGGFLVFQQLAALPFTTWFASNYSSAALWQGGKTPLWAYIDVHGLFLFLIFCLLVWESARWLRSVRVGALRGQGTLILVTLAIIGFTLLGSLVLAFVGYQAALIGLPMLLWVGILFFRPGQSRVMQFILALTGLALGLTIGVEFVVLAGDIGRQNTIFKFYIQAWLLFSVVGGVVFAVLLQSSDDWSNGIRVPWFSVLMVLVTMAAMYPIMATRAKAIERMAPDMPMTLDGMDYMLYSTRSELVSQYDVQTFSVSGDYDIIRWLQQNVQGSPIIMEGISASEYQWGNRIAIYTGLPSIIGWRWHQTQQRTIDPMPRLVDQRQANVNAFYFTSDINEAWRILQDYDVEYVIVSDFERARYTVRDQFGNGMYTGGIDKFDRMVEMGLLEEVYREGSGVIYRVNPDAPLELRLEIDAG